MAVDIPGGRGSSMYVLSGISLAVVWTSFALRAWARWGVVRSWGWDDSLMGAAVLCFTVMAGSMYALARNRFGDDPGALGTETMVALFQATIWGELSYTVTSMFFRLSVCSFYLRLTPTLWHIRVIRAVVAITTLYSLFYFFLMLNQCAPVSFFWTQFRDHSTGHCLSAPIIIGATCAHNTVSAVGDWVLNCLPLLLILPSTLGWRTKASALLLLCLGSVASVAIIVRFISLATIKPGTTAVPLAPPVAFWSALEAGVGIFAANAATYRPLLRSFARSIRSGSSDSFAGGGATVVLGPSKIRWPASGRRDGYALTCGEEEERGEAGVGDEDEEMGLGMTMGEVDEGVVKELEEWLTEAEVKSVVSTTEEGRISSFGGTSEEDLKSGVLTREYLASSRGNE